MSTTTLRRAVVASLGLGALATVPAATVGGAIEPPPPLASGHAEVVAQGIVDFPDGTFHWQVADGELVSGAPPTAVPEAVTFVLGNTGTVDVAAGAFTYRLGAGEGAMLPAMSDGLLTTPGDAATYWTLSLANVEQTGGAGATGGSFSLAAGLRDVDVVRDVLATDETMTVPDQEVAVLVLVTAGAVQVTSDGGGAIDLATGTGTTFDGELAITNAGAEPATVVAAVIGPTVEVLESLPEATSPPPQPNTDGAGGQDDGDGDGDDGTEQPTTTASTDSDADGLSDQQEMELGTDPNNADTEGDHVMDGDEVARGLDPLDNDTDNDFATDGDELNILGTDPNNPDTDGDGLIDSNEQPNGADPNNADTDGDGFGDGAEVGAGTNPADPNSHP